MENKNWNLVSICIGCLACAMGFLSGNYAYGFISLAYVCAELELYELKRSME